MNRQTLLQMTCAIVLATSFGCGKTVVQLPSSNSVLHTQTTQHTAPQLKPDLPQKTVTRKNVTPAKIALQPVSKETVKKEMELRQSKEETPDMDAAELETIQSLLAQSEEKIAEEDQQQSKAKPFAIKSAQGGKDVEIGLLLYNAKYIRKAKFWGLKNAEDFLKAGRSPVRRWTLKLKLEGLFAPGWFDQQLLFWIEQADLLRIPGVSRDDSYLLAANGVTSVPDLARRSNVIELGALKLSMTIMAFQYGMDAPSMDELKQWAEDAKTLEPMIY